MRFLVWLISLYDYDKNSNLTREFYAFVHNKLHYTITGKTAAELIAERVNLEHPTMGLTAGVYAGCRTHRVASK